MTSAIESSDYQEIRDRLKQDRAVIDMAQQLAVGIVAGHVTRDQFVHDSGTPRFELMQRANADYTRRLKEAGRADDQPRHIGAVAEAVVALVDRMIETYEKLSLTESSTKS